MNMYEPTDILLKKGGGVVPSLHTLVPSLHIIAVNQCAPFCQSLIDYFNFNISKYCMNKVRKFAMKFGYLIHRKIVKIVATRGQILRQKCTKFDFGWGSAPDPAGGAYK